MLVETQSKITKGANRSIFFAGNFAFGNIKPSSCAGSTPTDGQGLFVDTLQPYSQQVVLDNNVALFKGGSGIKVYANSTGSPDAQVYIRHNTTYAMSWDE